MNALDFLAIASNRRVADDLQFWQTGAAMAVPTNILVILGPTASGKSDLAMAVARRCGGEILSIDSMQVYRGMEIGTAKPNRADQAAVKHHLIDVADPNQTFTVARFVELADAVIADCAARRVPLIASGGTPLYYKALFQGLFDAPGEDAGLREELRRLSPIELHARLKAVDPAAAARIHANDTKRLIRALEVSQLTGRPISSLQTSWAAPPRYRATWVGINWPREVLNQRINARVKMMMACGWADEVKGLLERYGSLSKTAAEATGYAHLTDYLAGRLSLDQAIEQTKIATRQLARRQMKWFRRFAGVFWLSPPRQEIETWTDCVLAHWQNQ